MKRRVAVIPILIVFFVGFAGVARGQEPIGSQFQINSYTTGNQQNPAVAIDKNGNSVVVWDRYRQDGNSDGVYGQRFNSAGVAVGDEFQINTNGYMSVVAIEDIGNFVVAWSAGGLGLDYTSVRGRRFNSAGQAVGAEFQVNSYTTFRQLRPAVAMNDIGNFVIVWENTAGQDGSGLSVHGQLFDATGAEVGSEFQVNSYTTNNQEQPSVGMSDNGNFVVVWKSAGQNGNSHSVHGQLFHSSGDPSGGEFQVNDYTTGSKSYPAVAQDGSGYFFVAWNSFGPDGSSGAIQGRWFDSAGMAANGEFQINTYTTGQQTRPKVAEGGGSDFIVVWESYGQNGNVASVHGQVIRSNGMAWGSEIQVHEFTTVDSLRPRVAFGGDGLMVVTWQRPEADGSLDGILGQRFQISLFADSFENGSTSAWSSTIP